jgi:GxxExxY protein
MMNVEEFSRMMLPMKIGKDRKMSMKLVGKDVVYPELSYKLMGIAFEIHNILGPGFSENIYEAAFIKELLNRQIPFEQQKQIEVCYKGEIIGVYRLDLLIDNKIVIELKAVNGLNDLFTKQLISYLKASNYRLGILMNFGSKRLEHFRIPNTKNLSHSKLSSI